MGQKVHPHGLRLGIIKDWDSKWFANKKNFAEILLEDVKVRKFVKERLYTAGVSRIQIERAANRIRISIYAARPGIVIGRGGT
ncbi:MAG TPA: 30S ribosomal protein S3, partial [Desulfotomaculum sp.]|nr:30S ribosomal protein S3 [Desulfotomaculum sp.]